MRSLTWLAFFVVANWYVFGVDSSKILFIGAVGSRSHKNFYMGIINELVENNHHVTFVTPFASKKKHTNIRELVVKEGDVINYSHNRFNEPTVPGPNKILEYASLCLKTMENDDVKALNEEKFDLVFLSTFFLECYFSLIYQLKVPFIYTSSIGLVSPYASAMGNPLFRSCVTIPVYEHVHPLTFLQRTHNAITEFLGHIFMVHWIYKEVEADCRSLGICPPDMPPFAEMKNNASLMFLNSIKALEVPPRPYMQNVVHVGGIHCHPGKPLPEDLEEWIEGAGEHGFIYFSLGSTVTPSDMLEKDRQVFLKVFGSLKQRILWKWNMDSMPDLPPNVRLEKWLPQQDILSHSKLRLFITQGGLLSTYEAMYHAKPVLGLPVFADQRPNMNEIERQGWGKVILWKDLSEEVLLEKINFVMKDEKMRQRVQEMSILMKSQPISPKSLVTFWTDYVIKHRGAKHLRSPLAGMPWYKVINMDVWMLLLTMLIASLWLLLRLCGFIISCLRRKPKNKAD